MEPLRLFAVNSLKNIFSYSLQICLLNKLNFQLDALKVQGLLKKTQMNNDMLFIREYVNNLQTI